MPRYVVLEHDHPSLHWDFMLEVGEVLWTWRLPAPPAPGCDLPAEAIGDHRPAYLEYEGPVSGGRGRVVRYDRGTYRGAVNRGERMVLQLDGGRFTSAVVLEPGVSSTWQFRVPERSVSSPTA